MKKLVFIMGALFLCFSLLLSQGQKGEKVSLTLNDCILKALENNLDISVSAFEPEISELSVSEAREKFYPQLGFDYRNDNRTYLGNWWVEGTFWKTKTSDLNIGVSQKLITGGDITLSIANNTSDTTRSLTTINPTYGSQLFLSFTQPLLKNFGSKMARREVVIAKNNRDISLQTLKSALIQTVYQVEEAYWSLVYAIENLEVIEYSVAQSRSRLEMTKEAERVGSKSSLEVLASETDLAGWEERVLSARLQVARSEDQLKQLLNHSPRAVSGVASLTPVDKPEAEKREISVEEAFQTALEERPEMAINQKEMEKSTLDIGYYKNQLLPQVDLRAYFWSPGQSGDMLIYKDNDPLTGEVVGVVKGSRWDALKDAFKLTYGNWQISLDLTIPLSNVLSRAGLAKAKLLSEKSMLEKENQEKTIYYEVLEALKELKNNEQKIETSTKYRELKGKQVASEEEKYKLGLGSIEWLLTYQRDLASAKVAEIRAIIDYKLSIAKLEKTMGTNLKEKNIKFRDYLF